MSNKTRTAPVKETESAPNKNPVRLILGLILILAGIIAVVSGVRSVLDTKQQLYTPNSVIAIEIADTAQARQRGLSYRDTLDDSSGMLFVFDEASTQHCFWMKDMRFAIDMIWLNENKKVVYTKTNIDPSTYPTSFCPDIPARYVLEVNAGRAADFNLVKDVTVKF